MLKNFVKLFSGDPNKKTIEQYSALVVQVNALEAEFEALSDEALRAKTDEFKARFPHPSPSTLTGTRPTGRGIQGEGGEEELKKFEQDILDEIMPEAFALVREASKRTLGLRHYDVQIIGGATQSLAWGSGLPERSAEESRTYFIRHRHRARAHQRFRCRGLRPAG